MKVRTQSLLVGVRETGPGTPLKRLSKGKGIRVRGRTRLTAQPLNSHEEREVRAGWVKWHLDRLDALPHWKIAVLCGVEHSFVDCISAGKTFRAIPACEPPKENQ